MMYGGTSFGSSTYGGFFGNVSRVWPYVKRALPFLRQDSPYSKKESPYSRISG